MYCNITQLSVKKKKKKNRKEIKNYLFMYSSLLGSTLQFCNFDYGRCVSWWYQRFLFWEHTVQEATHVLLVYIYFIDFINTFTALQPYLDAPFLSMLLYDSKLFPVYHISYSYTIPSQFQAWLLVIVHQSFICRFTCDFVRRGSASVIRNQEKKASIHFSESYCT